MMQKLKSIFPLAHPQHIILGLALIGIGLILICNDYYFFWPPFAAKALNDDLVVTAGLLAFEATAELCHGYVRSNALTAAGYKEITGEDYVEEANS